MLDSQSRNLLIATVIVCGLCFWSWWRVTLEIPNNVCNTTFAKCY